MGTLLDTYGEALVMVHDQPLGTYAICRIGAVWVKTDDNCWFRHSETGIASYRMCDADLAKYFHRAKRTRNGSLTGDWMFS